MASAVSIVMVSYYTGPVLSDAIAAALAQPELRELILVDNGNPDPVIGDLRRRAADEPRLVLLSGHGNVGFAAGCNLGAKRATGGHLLLLNPDCLLPVGGLRLLLAEGRLLPRPWLIGGRLVNPDGSEQRGARRELLTPRNAVAEVCRLDRLFPRRFAGVNLNEAPLPSETTEVPVVSGACMFLPAEDYWLIGGMDEGYFLHVEDIDFCHRFRAAGGMIAFAPTISILHHKGTSQASGLTVEWHKTRGFLRHFRKTLGRSRPLLLALVDAGIILRFAVLAGAIALRRIGRLSAVSRQTEDGTGEDRS